jgi:hypothetical protein
MTPLLGRGLVGSERTFVSQSSALSRSRTEIGFNFKPEPRSGDAARNSARVPLPTLDLLFPLLRSNDDSGRAAVFRDFLRPFRFRCIEQFAELCLGFSDCPCNVCLRTASQFADDKLQS